MDQSGTFARHFARLVSLLMHEVGNVDEQKVSLRALVTLSRNGEVTLAERDLGLQANGNDVPAALTGVRDVAAQMAAHSILSIRIGAASGPADILGLARIIAASPSPGDGGAHATQKLLALKPQNIEFETPALPKEPEARAPTASDAPTVVHHTEGKTAAEAM